MNYQITHDGFLCRGLYVIGKIIDMETLRPDSVLLTLTNMRFNRDDSQVCIKMSDISVPVAA